MENTKIIKYSLLIAVILTLGVFSVALAQGEVEPSGIESPDCDNGITIKKITDPATPGIDYNFTITKSRGSTTYNGITYPHSFSLQHDGSKTFSNVEYNWGGKSVIYTITETIDPNVGSTLKNISCSVVNGSGVPQSDVTIERSIAADGKSGYAAITMKDYRYVTCTFTNGVKLDFGDLPEGTTYNYTMTSLANDGARHIPGNLYLGSGIDAESDGQPTDDALGDDRAGESDEDGGVKAPEPYKWVNGQGSVIITVTGGAGCLSGWMDVWNSESNLPGADGDFDDSGINGNGAAWNENIINNMYVTPGAHTIPFNLPEDAATFTVFARFRLVPDANGDGVCSQDEAPQLTGLVNNGEVEDYAFNFDPSAVSLQSFSAVPFDASAMVLIPAVLGVGLLGVFFSARKKS
ncbi:MAG: hypothetical protein GYA34_01145 [Chloroflexi bacterium]|nr:hypothetical protein [Chloroflexota bacterium]